MRLLLIFIVVFVNYFNPISIYFTLFVNVVIAVLAYTVSNKVKFDSFLIFNSFIILCIAMCAMALRDNFNTYVFGKYFRVFTSTILLSIIFSGIHIGYKNFVNLLMIMFFLHILFVGLQLIYPSLDVPMAYFFGFDREASVITEMSIRKLGLSTSYDSAALISISAMGFYCIQFKYKDKFVYLFIAALALLTTLVISRTGMILGSLIFAGFLFYFTLKMKGKKKLAPLSFLLFGFYVSSKFVLPILIASNILFLNNLELTSDVVDSDYTSGSYEALTSTHLDALNVSVVDLVFGYGKDPNKFYGKATDIGYVKLLYHIGFIGTLLVFLLLYYIFIRLRTVITTNKSVDKLILAEFARYFIGLLLLMNYKSLELYSRGSHDLLLMVFFFVVYNNEKSPLLEKNVMLTAQM